MRLFLLPTILIDMTWATSLAPFLILYFFDGTAAAPTYGHPISEGPYYPIRRQAYYSANLTSTSYTPTPTVTSSDRCSAFACPLGGLSGFDTVLQACACPAPPCVALPCPFGFTTGLVNGTCTCVAPCVDETCIGGFTPSFNQSTRTCLCPAVPPYLWSNISTTSVNTALALSSSTTIAPAPAPIATYQPFLPPPPPQSDIVPALIQLALDLCPESTGQVYAAVPYFALGHIAIDFQLCGQVDGFILNASTAISSIGLNRFPQPNLILVPRYIANATSTEVGDTAQIIAISNFSLDGILYYVQLANGTVIQLSGDKFVHYIDLMDPAQPPSLAILTSPGAAQLYRKPAVVKSSGTQRRGLSGEIEDRGLAGRGLAGVSSSTATMTEVVCEQIICITTNSPAVFNKFTNSCYCPTVEPALTVPEISGWGKRASERAVEGQAQ
jgi:hypothetical protein